MKLLLAALFAATAFGQYTFSGIFCTSAVGSDAYACTPNASVISYQTGAFYAFKADVANTGTASFNAAGLGAKTIVIAAGGVTTMLSDNAIRAGQIVVLQYDGTNMQMQSTSGIAPLTSIPSQYKTKSCVVAVGDPGAASPALANDNDSPVACDNDTGGDWTLTYVGCWADAGSPTVTPILTGGTSTSILSGALTCGTAGWAAGSLNGSPVIHSFSAGATCGSTPCSADVNITTAGGTAKYIVVRLVGTY